MRPSSFIPTNTLGLLTRSNSTQKVNFCSLQTANVSIKRIIDVGQKCSFLRKKIVKTGCFVVTKLVVTETQCNVKLVSRSHSAENRFESKICEVVSCCRFITVIGE